ncbi:unnamed protein product [Caenorhabditis bovis]|uniref:DNA-directed RNA polymerase III subunit RPC3 n=1 Tax=Caenorhabditis bovis TaxID=2654633 RepID=A0A8S1EZZ7_9PELO|nr:unnamed protein product [Caenorhabditis bovis]
MAEESAEQKRFADLVFQCSESSSSAVEAMERLLGNLKETKNDKEGLSLLKVKNYEMVAYLSELTVLMSKMMKGDSIIGESALKRALKHRVILEKMRPIEDKMKPQIEKLLSKKKDGSKGALRVRLENMDVNDDDEDEEEEEEDGEKKAVGKEPKKYVAPKIRAVHYDEEDEAPDKKLEKAKRRAMQSSLIMELKNQYSEAPEEIREVSERKYQFDREREKYEEEHFTRIRLNKEQRRKSEKLGRHETLDDLLNFGDYMMRGEDGRSMSENLKRKRLSSGAGETKRRKKTQKERKKAQRSKKEGKVRLTMGGGKYETQLCLAIIDDLFGKIVARVAETLMKESSHFMVLAFKLKGRISPTLIRKSLATLINFGFVKFALDGNRTLYTVDTEQILHVITAPRACLIAKTLFGTIAEAICEELFAAGKATCSTIIRKVLAREETANVDEIRAEFAKLAGSQFIIRLAPIAADVHGCPQFENLYDQFAVPDNVLGKTSIEAAVEAGKRKRKEEDEGSLDGDHGLYWRINWNRVDAYLRDEMILEYLVGNATTTEDRIHQMTCNVAKLMLKCDEVRSSALKPPTLRDIAAQVYDILRIAKETGVELTKPDVEIALQILCDESDGVVRKVGESAGGLYIIDVKRAITMICRGHCESLIREQFEGRAIRIMRLLETRHFLDEEQVEKQSMMSAKEAREMLYALVEEGYVFTKAVGRSNDFQPARTFYLYHVDLHRTVRGLVEYTCKLIRNLILRNAFERKENRHLLEKDATVGPIVDGIRANEELDEASKQAQIAEVQEMYLPGPDRAQLAKYRQAEATLLASQDRASRVLLSFKLFLQTAMKPV